jgi:lipid-A-disaccharide synthase
MSGTPLTIGIVAGEASGDTLGAYLINALRERLPHARFTGIGGPKMQGAGMEILFPLEKLAVRGYVEVLRHYLEIVGIRRRLAVRFQQDPPALFIGVDAPDFNLDLETELKSAGIPTVHYVSPQIWAWRSSRMRKIRRAVSKMLVVFPFETALYEKAGVPVSYVGHPLADMLAQSPGRLAMREQLRLPASAKVIALLPGSRVSELEQMAGNAPEVLFLAPLVNRTTKEVFESALYRRETGELNLTVLFGHAHEAMAAADVVLAASGTATLEAALLARPMVITYKMPRMSWWIMRNRHYQPYVGLPNILAGEFVVPEFIQHEATPENLSQAVLNLLFDATVRGRVETRLGAMARHLRQNTRERVAEVLVPMLGTGAQR